MKKYLALALALILAIGLLAGCSGGSGGSEGGNSEGGKETLTMATGGTTGTYYAFGASVAQLFNEKISGLTVTVESSGASKANVFSVSDGKADIALVQNDVADYGYNGTDLFADSGAEKGFSVMAAAYAEVCQIVAVDGINSIEDLKGKNVSVGDAGSGCEFNAHQILEAYGLTFDDITVHNLGFGESADAIKDGKIDAFFCVAGAPTTAIVDLCTTKDVNIINIDDEHAAKLMEKYPFYSQYTIPAGTYSSVKEDAKTVAVKATFIVSNELSEDVVYNMTKTLFENSADISHAKAAELNTEYAVGSISVPFHPGAEKYFKEIGAIK